MGLKGGLAAIILHLANFLYFCGGVIIMTFGAIGIANVDLTINTLTYIPSFSQLANILYLPGLTYGPSIYLTIAGTIAIVLSFLGCGGAFKMSRPLVFLYGGTNLVFMLFNIALIMYHVIAPYNIQSTVEYNMKLTLQSYFNPVYISSNGQVSLPTTNPEASAWVEMQFKQGCCGVESYKDYASFTWNNSFPNVNGGISGAKVPPSCCVQKIPYIVTNNTLTFVNLTECLTNPPLYTNSRGCIDYVMSQFTEYDYVYTVVAAALTGFQAIILVCTMRLMALEFEKRHI